jgi:uncharacterized repeat protein (TIGR02543 family)
MAALLTIGLAVGFVTTAQAAAPVLSTASSASYTENASPVDVLSNLAVSGGPFDGGWIEISVASGTSEETLSVPQVGTLGEISTTSGAITVYDDKLYLGEGGSYTQIGQISSSQTGVGEPLRFEFVSSFENAGFEGIPNNTYIDSNPIAGWTAKTDALIKPGTTTLNFDGTNYTIPDTWKKENYSCSGSSALLASNSTLSTLETYVTNADQNEGTNSLRLRSSGTITEGGRVAFGPLVFSDEFAAENGQTLFFDWRANAGGDNYHVLSYIVKIDGSPSVSDWTEILDQHGNSSTASTSWSTQSVSIPSTGTYRFVFISGTQDYTCARGVGASLYIDNVQVVGSKADATAVQTLARKVQYSSTEDNPPTTRTLNVEAESGDSNTDTFNGASTITITAVDDSPAVEDEAVTVNATNTSTDPVTVTGTLTLSDPDSTESVSIDSGIAESGTVSTVSYDQKIETDEGTFYLDSSNGEYAFEAPLADFIGNTDSRSTTIGVTASGDGVTDTATVTVNLSPTGAPGAVTNIQSAIFGSNIGLSWTAPTFLGGSVITGYKIEKLVSGSYQTLVADTGTAVTSWDSGSGAASQDTTFRISAINSSGVGLTQTYVQPASYTITYSAGTGGSNAPSNVTVLPGGTFSADDSTGLSNSDSLRTFVHWSDGTNTYAASETVTPNSDLTLTAIWTSKITYDANGGTGSVAADYGYPDSALADGSALERSGFEFVGWNTQANGRGTSYSAGNTLSLTADVTLYAQWSAIVTATLSTPAFSPNSDEVIDATVTGASLVGDSSKVYEASISATSGTFTLTDATLADCDGDGNLAEAATGVYCSPGKTDVTDVSELKFRSNTTDSLNTVLDAVTFNIADSETADLSLSVSEVSSSQDVYKFGDHYYEYVADSGVSATAAETAAEAKSFFGLSGYLVNITSEAENDFVANEAQATDIWIGASDRDSEGNWAWIGGPEEGQVFFKDPDDGIADAATYNLDYFSAWSSNEPNDYNSGEDYAVTNWSGGVGKWNDLPSGNTGASGYFVEYGDDSETVLLSTASSSTTVSASSTPTPYTGPIINGPPNGENTEFSATGTETVVFEGDRLGTITNALINGKEAEIVSVSETRFEIVIPKGLAPGTHDLKLQTSLGNLTYLDAITITPQAEDTSPIEFAEVSSWTKRISDDQLKVYVKFPTVGEKVRISHQTGGSGSYETVYVRTTSSETMEGLRIVEGVGTYIVRTINLSDINRIRVTVGDEELVQIRYNN